jgi:hypothetical protein
MDSFGGDVLGRDLVGDVDDKLVRDLARDSKRRPLRALASPCRSQSHEVWRGARFAAERGGKPEGSSPPPSTSAHSPPASRRAAAAQPLRVSFSHLPTAFFRSSCIPPSSTLPCPLEFGLAWRVLGGSVRCRPRYRRPARRRTYEGCEGCLAPAGCIEGREYVLPYPRGRPWCCSCCRFSLPVLPPHHLCSAPAAPFIFRRSPIVYSPSTLSSDYPSCYRLFEGVMLPACTIHAKKIHSMVHVSCVF